MRKIALLLLALVVGCTSSTGTRSANPKAVSPGADSTERSSPAADDSLTPGATGSPSRGISGSPSDPGTQEFPLELTVAPACATRNQTMRATAVTEPQTRLGFVASYSDDNYVPDFTYVESAANPTGTYTWIWVLKPDTPLGEGLVTVVAAKEGRGGARKARFLVAEKC